MGRKRHGAEQIIAKLREAEVELARGKTSGEVCRKLGITEQTYYRWRREYGGLRVDQARRLKELERENARLKKLVADQALDVAILREAAKGNFSARRGGAEPWSGFASGSGSPNGGRVGCWGRRGRRSGIGRVLAPTKRGW